MCACKDVGRRGGGGRDGERGRGKRSNGASQAGMPHADHTTHFTLKCVAASKADLMQEFCTV